MLNFKKVSHQFSAVIGLLGSYAGISWLLMTKLSMPLPLAYTFSYVICFLLAIFYIRQRNISALFHLTTKFTIAALVGLAISEYFFNFFLNYAKLNTALVFLLAIIVSLICILSIMVIFTE